MNPYRAPLISLLLIDRIQHFQNLSPGGCLKG